MSNAGEHAQVKTGRFACLLSRSFLCNTSPLARQMCQFGAVDVSNTLALLFWILFTRILPEAITTELCFGDTGECWPNISRLVVPDTEFPLNLLLTKKVRVHPTERSVCPVL